MWSGHICRTIPVGYVSPENDETDYLHCEHKNDDNIDFWDANDRTDFCMDASVGILRVIYQYVFPTSLPSDILLFAFLTVEFLVD